MDQFKQFIALIEDRISALRRTLEASLRGGTAPDSYNVGWLEGGVYELEQLRETIADVPDSESLG